MNEKLNLLLKAYNSFDLSLEEEKILKKDIAMEILLSAFVTFSIFEDGSLGCLCNDDEDTAIIFSSYELGYEGIDDDIANNPHLKENLVSIESFMELSKNGENISIDINPSSDYYYHLGTEELIYLDEVYSCDEFRDYWRSDSTRYLKDTIKHANNQSFIDCYDIRLKSLADELLEKIENVESTELQCRLIEDALIKNKENYQKYTEIFDDELLEEISNLKIFFPIFNDDATPGDEYNGVIDVIEYGGEFSIAHIKLDYGGYMMGFTDIDKLTNHDDIFLPNVDAKNKNYYVSVKPFPFVIEFIATHGVQGLILNMGQEDHFIIEVDTIVEHFDKLMKTDDIKLINASDLALNHLLIEK